MQEVDQPLRAEASRESKETRVLVAVDLRQAEAPACHTGVGFFDHMLQQLGFHGRFGLTVRAEGDLHFDDHHTVEDVGIVMGKALAKAVQGQSIVRYGQAITPMDEALTMVALDFSGRGVLGYEVPFVRERIGELATENIREFCRALSTHGGISLHVRKLAGENDHHVAESLFKGLGRAIFEATRPIERGGVISTKGVID
jgi:imidazoleglycerol-phosphate dehydratase